MTEIHFTPKITDDVVKMHQDYLVPAIYAQWAHHTSDLAAIETGQTVLDVACRTGTLTRTVQLEVGLKGKVIGLDHSPKMLAKAKELAPSIEWQLGEVGALPYEDDSFDRVLCQFALMFIKNRVAAVKEMMRVCKPDGLVVIAIWAPLDHSKAYSALLGLTWVFAGHRTAFKLAAPWSLGASGKMDSVLLSAGANEYEGHERPGIAIFPSVETFVETHLRVTDEFHTMSEQDFTKMLESARDKLEPFIMQDGRVSAALDASVFLVSPK
jgi:SAM-dependent methyltransferase